MTFRGVRRLDAALSSDPHKICDEVENASGSRTKSAEENAEASKNLENVSTAPTRWIAAVSAAEETSRGAAEARTKSTKK